MNYIRPVGVRIYDHEPQIVYLGNIMGKRLFVELTGDPDLKEKEYVQIKEILLRAFVTNILPLRPYQEATIASIRRAWDERVRQVEVPPTPTTDTEIEKLPRPDLGSARCTCDWPPEVPGVPHRPWCATNGGQAEPEDTGEASQDAAPDAPRGAETVLGEIAQERLRQDAKWGQQNHPDGTGPRVPFGGRLCYMADAARDARLATNAAAGKTPGLEHHGPLTWRHILLEEVFEALAEAEPAALRAELVQIGAVSVAWVEAIDRRTAADA